MPGESFVLRVTGTTRIKAPAFNAQQLRQIGAAAVHTMNERLDRFQNVLDMPAKPYSGHGPIYIPISGRGTFKQRRFDEVFGAYLYTQKRRNKTNFGGREVVTAKDIKAMRDSGRVYIIGGRKGSRGGVQPGQVVATHTGRSLKFANWAAYKRALGRSGMRDLYLSGKMRGAIAIVSITRDTVTIGFTREDEHAKALGNQKIDPWFGLSPNDRQAILAFAQGLLPPVASAMIV